MSYSILDEIPTGSNGYPSWIETIDVVVPLVNVVLDEDTLWNEGDTKSELDQQLAESFRATLNDQRQYYVLSFYNQIEPIEVYDQSGRLLGTHGDKLQIVVELHHPALVVGNNSLVINVIDTAGTEFSHTFTFHWNG